jgi:hypothetical protein
MFWLSLGFMSKHSAETVACMHYPPVLLTDLSGIDVELRAHQTKLNNREDRFLSLRPKTKIRPCR